jgi:hypothetical protein
VLNVQEAIGFFIFDDVYFGVLSPEGRCKRVGGGWVTPTDHLLGALRKEHWRVVCTSIIRLGSPFKRSVAMFIDFAVASLKHP